MKLSDSERQHATYSWIHWVLHDLLLDLFLLDLEVRLLADEFKLLEHFQHDPQLIKRQLSRVLQALIFEGKGQLLPGCVSGLIEPREVLTLNWFDHIHDDYTLSLTSELVSRPLFSNICLKSSKDYQSPLPSIIKVLPWFWPSFYTQSSWMIFWLLGL